MQSSSKVNFKNTDRGGIIIDLHGGNVYRAAKELELSRKAILDYSANINPLGFPASVPDIIQRHIQDIIYYPDPEQQDLIDAASAYFKVNPENLVPGNGAAELIAMAIETLRPKKAFILSPTFSEYALACKVRSIETILIDLSPKDFIFDLEVFESIKNDISPGDVVILCNPNNPTGKLIRKNLLKTIALELEKRKAYLFIDEAFMDFVEEDCSMVEHVGFITNLLILKSLTKFFAIPGLRLGFLISNRNLIQRLYSFKAPWNLNTFAGFVGQEVLRDKEFIKRTKRYISQEKIHFHAKLKEIPEFYPFYPAANYIFVKLKGIDGKTLASKLKDRGILIRRCANFPFLDDSYIRLAVRKQQDNKIFINTINQIFKGE